MGLFIVVAIIVTRWSYFIEVCWHVPSCCYMNGRIVSYFT